MTHCSQNQTETVEYRRLATKTRWQYRVGADGSVWSITTRKGADWKRLKAWSDDQGYLQVRVGSRARYVHRLVLEAFAGPPPDPDMVCRHANDNNTDNRPDNLSWGFPGDNTADAFRNARMWVGSRVHCAKIDEDAARAIVAAHRSGVTQVELARRYGLSTRSIANITSGHCWSHATGVPYNPRSRARRLTPIPTVHPATTTT